MRIAFFMPEKYLPDPTRREAWKSGAPVSLEPGGKIACVQCWIFQTWAALHRIGVPVDLVHQMPESGIVLALTGTLDSAYRPPKDLFLAGIVADGLPHAGAHLQILQNAAHARCLSGSVFMPLWPQPNLLPRDPDRGDRFETVHFFGDARNLADELADPAFASTMRQELGLSFSCVTAEHWNDYRETDCALAIRSFQPSRWLHKPSTKLYNAWLAEVPFVGGTDSSYASDGREGEDFLACRSLPEVSGALSRLKSDPELRRSLVSAGRTTVRAFTTDAIAERWRELVTRTLPALAEKWQKKSALERRVVGKFRSWRLEWDRLTMN